MITQDKMLVYEHQARILKALAHPLRVAVVDFLSSGPQCVCDIADHLGQERSNVSRHLSKMVSGGILSCEKQGLKMIYQLRTPCILNFFSCASDIIKQNIDHHTRLARSL